MTYHYTESGLDNIYLENGFTEHKTAYGDGVSIHNTAGLHKAIGKWLVARPIPLNGAELRFLRIEMELTQRDLAGIIGATEQTLRLWEKTRDKFIPGTADRLVRALYFEFAGGDVHIRKMLERLADLDRQENVPACFSTTNSRWKPRQAPQLEEIQA
jgi:putative transcriptional regulator